MPHYKLEKSPHWFSVKLPIHPKEQKKRGEWLDSGYLLESSCAGFLESRGFTFKRGVGWLFTNTKVCGILVTLTNKSRIKTHILLSRDIPAQISRLYRTSDMEACDAFGNVIRTKVEPVFPK